MEIYSEKIYNKYYSFINQVCEYLSENYGYKYNFITKKQKYDSKIIITELIYLLESGVSYEHYRGPVNSKTLNKHSIFISKNNIFEKVYEAMYDKYIQINKYSKLKYQSIDSSFIINKNGKEGLARNKFCKNKNCFKLSLLVDSNGIAEKPILVSGNLNDAKIGINNVVNCTNKKYNKQINPYILADKGYDSNEFKNVCIQNNFKPIIDYNKRNTKNICKIRKLTQTEKQIYKKRIKVENTFSIIKKFKRIQLVYDSYKSTFFSFIKLGMCIMITKYL